MGGAPLHEMRTRIQAEPRVQRLDRARDADSIGRPFESNSAYGASGQIGKMGNEAAKRNGSPVAGPAGETDPEVSRGVFSSLRLVRVGREGLRGLDTSIECEMRWRRSDGVFRWFLFQREPLRDQTGAVVGWYGTAPDIED
jgi:hypothetical protein